MEDPDTVEVDEQVRGGTLLKVSLEEDSAPIYASEAQVAFGRSYVDQARLDANEYMKEKGVSWRTLLSSTMRARPSGYQKSWLISS